MSFIEVFNVSSFGILKLPAITSGNASFSLNLSSTGQYCNNTAVALTLLVIKGTNMALGTYTYASFTSAQQAFIGDNAGTITVVNSAPTLIPHCRSGNHRWSDLDAYQRCHRSQRATAGFDIQPAGTARRHEH